VNQRRRAVLVLPDADIELTLPDTELARRDHDIVAVLGHGAGWFAALAVAGVLSMDDARLVVRELVEQPRPDGGQLIYPLTDAAWRPDGRLRSEVDAALAEAGDEASEQLDLGAYSLLGGSRAGIEALLARLPAMNRGGRDYPLHLPLRSVLHTPMAIAIVERLRARTHEIAWQVPQLTLIDGRGMRHTPWSADPAGLGAYSVGPQLSETHHVASAVRVALREYAPDLVVIPGNGGTLAAVCGQLVVAEGYRGIGSRAAFVEVQRRRPIVLSVRHRAP